MSELYLDPINKITLQIKSSGNRKQWTISEYNKLKELYPNTSNLKLAIIFNVSKSAIINRANKLGLRKSKEFLSNPKNRNLFEKGHIPFNKNKKGFMGKNITSFKKGNLPKNTKYDGYISIRKHKGRENESYKYIRISQGKFVLLHRYNFENKYGKIPKGMILVCKDKNTLNCDSENWECITRKENLRRNYNRKKITATITELWKTEKIRQKYGLTRLTKLRIK
jgi:hypothetical protein